MEKIEYNRVEKRKEQNKINQKNKSNRIKQSRNINIDYGKNRMKAAVVKQQ